MLTHRHHASAPSSLPIPLPAERAEGTANSFQGRRSPQCPQANQDAYLYPHNAGRGAPGLGLEPGMGGGGAEPPPPTADKEPKLHRPPKCLPPQVFPPPPSSSSSSPLPARPATHRMVVWGDTAGTLSSIRCMQRTVVRKQRQRLGHQTLPRCGGGCAAAGGGVVSPPPRSSSRSRRQSPGGASRRAMLHGCGAGGGG